MTDQLVADYRWVSEWSSTVLRPARHIIGHFCDGHLLGTDSERKELKSDKPTQRQNHQALLKAKYCPQVAEASRTRKNKKNQCDLDLWPMPLKFNRVLKVVEVDVRAKFSSS